MAFVNFFFLSKHFPKGNGRIRLTRTMGERIYPVAKSDSDSGKRFDVPFN